MKILVTGAKGFIGRNLITGLKNNNYTELFEYDKDTNLADLEQYCAEADFVFHLAGVNRSELVNDFEEVNVGFTKQLLNYLSQCSNACPVVYSSSIQSILDNPYGRSKKAAENILSEYARSTGARVFIYRLPNVFGKWCRPGYNSAVATFCHNTAYNQPLHIHDPEHILKLVFIDDLVEEFIRTMTGYEDIKEEFLEVAEVYSVSVGQLAELISDFKYSREGQLLPDMSDAFTRKLYGTYISCLPEHQFGYELKMNTDQRGSFTEFLKTAGGQISVNRSKPGMMKGNHWHSVKNEKFLVVSGSGVVRLRSISSDVVISYYIRGEKPEVIDIPVGYVHNIENLGKTDLITLIWASEVFDPKHPDTYYMEV